MEAVLATGPRVEHGRDAHQRGDLVPDGPGCGDRAAHAVPQHDGALDADGGHRLR